MTVSINDEVQELLAETRKVLETDGWTQGTFYRDGKHCLVGALVEAKGRLRGQRIIYPRNVECEAVATLLSHLGSIGPISRWNDEPERTYEEVIQLLKDVEHGLGAGEL